MDTICHKQLEDSKGQSHPYRSSSSSNTTTYPENSNKNNMINKNSKRWPPSSFLTIPADIINKKDSATEINGQACTLNR